MAGAGSCASRPPCQEGTSEAKIAPRTRKTGNERIRGKHMTFKPTRREVALGLAGTALLGPRALAQSLPPLPTSPVALNLVDVAGNLALTQSAIERYRKLKPELVSKISFAKAPAPELPGKIKAQQDAKQVDIHGVLTGIDTLSSGIDQKLWIPILPQFAARLPKLDDIYLPGALAMQGMTQNQGVCIVFCPAGPVMEYMPDKVKQPPSTAEELLAWAKANPNRFLYARPANSGPARVFMMGLPYLLGDKDPKDPEKGWDKTWAYLKELGQYIEYYPSGTGAVMKELGEGSRDMVPSQTGWDINPRALGVVPKEAKVFFLKGFHWIMDAHYPVHPERRPARPCRGPHRHAVLSPLQGGAGDDLRHGLFLSRPRGEGRARLDGARREPQGHRGIRPAGLRQDHRRQPARDTASPGQAGVRLQPLGPGDRGTEGEVRGGLAPARSSSRLLTLPVPSNPLPSS